MLCNKHTTSPKPGIEDFCGLEQGILQYEANKSSLVLRVSSGVTPILRFNQLFQCQCTTYCVAKSYFLFASLSVDASIYYSSTEVVLFVSLQKHGSWHPLSSSSAFDFVSRFPDRLESCQSPCGRTDPINLTQLCLSKSIDLRPTAQCVVRHLRKHSFGEWPFLSGRSAVSPWREAKVSKSIISVLACKAARWRTFRLL